MHIYLNEYIWEAYIMSYYDIVLYDTLCHYHVGLIIHYV